MRTYSGHSSAKASNELYRLNLRRDRPGLSVAFDLPTQTGYDTDHPIARGEVGKVGVPIDSIADMEDAVRGHTARPHEHVDDDQRDRRLAARALHRRRRAPGRRSRRCCRARSRTTSSRSTCRAAPTCFRPAPSLRLTGDIIAYTVRDIPKWNPINICSYHLQEAGATPVEEIAFTLANAKAVLDEVRKRPGIDDQTLARVFGRISFFVNAGIRFIEEMCKMRAFVSRVGRARPRSATASPTRRCAASATACR